MWLFLGHTYWYNTANDGRREIGVVKGYDHKTHIVAWVSDTGGLRRIMSQRLPPRGSSALSRHELTSWAMERKLEQANYYPVEGENNMSKKQKEVNAAPDPRAAVDKREVIADKIKSLMDDLLVRNIGEIERIREKLMGVEVKISYCERHKDALASPVDDPDQEKLSLA